jgi:teichoic acid transport system permease protein
MAMGNLRARNASTVLGLFWWVLNPLLLGMVYWVVFGIIMPISRDISFLLSGMFAFYYTTTSITGGANSVISNSRLLANLSFPRLILPITAIVEASVGFLASLVALYLIIGPTDGVWPGWYTVALLPPAFVIQTTFNLGAATLAARIAVPFRDVNNLIPYLLRLWLYLSPIIYGLDFADNLPDPWNTIYYLNPMVPMLAFYRAALLGSELTSFDVWASIAWALVVAGFAIASFVKYEGRIARYV